MKSFITAMIIFFLLIFFGIAFNNCLNDVSENLIENAEKISGFIEDGKFDQAGDGAEKLSRYIDEKKPLLSSILDHGNIDEIEKEISGLLAYSEQTDKINAAASVKKLKHMFEHLPENYVLELQNIL